MSIPAYSDAYSDVAADLFKLISYAEVQLGGAAIPELDEDGVPRSSWMIPFRGAQLTIHPFVDAKSTVQILVYVGRDTIKKRPGKIIWACDPSRYYGSGHDGMLRGDDLKPAIDEAVKVLKARPFKDWPL